MSATLAPDKVVEIRSKDDGVEVAEVSFPKRIVTVIAMPYEQPTEIFEHGKVFTEVVSRGAFSGIEKRSGKLRANRDHDWDKLCGKVVALHPSRSEGLVAEVKMFTTEIGERTLVECAQDGLDASAGFMLLRREDGRVYDDAEAWERDRSVRRLNRLWLDHVAFVPNPAYPGAEVEEVRKDSVRPQDAPRRDGRPNLVQVYVDGLLAVEADMNRRYTRG